MRNHWRKVHVNDRMVDRPWRLQYGSVHGEGWCLLLEERFPTPEMADRFIDGRPPDEFVAPYSQDWHETHDGESPWPVVQLEDVVAEIGRKSATAERESKLEVLEKLKINQGEPEPIRINKPVKPKRRKMVAK